MLWNKELNYASGTLILAFKTGLPAADLRALAERVYAVAVSMGNASKGSA